MGFINSVAVTGICDDETIDELNDLFYDDGEYCNIENRWQYGQDGAIGNILYFLHESKGLPLNLSEG